MIYGIFGKPRSGKTTFAQMLIYKDYKRYNTYHHIKNAKIKELYRRFRPFHDFRFCSDPTISYAIHIDFENFGKWCIPYNSLIVFEEAGLGFDNREWKTLSKDAKRMFAFLGHRKSDLYWSSQTADVDKSLRVRTQQLYMLSRAFGHFSFLEPIYFTLGPDDQGNIVEKYYVNHGLARILDFLRRSSRLIYRKPYYKLFDSYVDEHLYTDPVPPPVKLPEQIERRLPT